MLLDTIRLVVWTPLKNMTSSIGIIPNPWENKIHGNQTTNQLFFGRSFRTTPLTYCKLLQDMGQLGQLPAEHPAGWQHMATAQRFQMPSAWAKGAATAPVSWGLPEISAKNEIPQWPIQQ